MSFIFGFMPTRAVIKLLVITVAAFVLQLLTSRVMPGIMIYLFGLSLPTLRMLMLWQPITYMFVHASFSHLFFNMLGLYFFGPDIERTIGTKRFIWFYLACGFVGGMGWLLLSGGSGIPCVGASGAIFGLLGMFAALFPNRSITLLLFFIIPITVRARTLAILLGVFSLIMLLQQSGDQIAHAAHLLGGILGYGYGFMLSHGSFHNGPASFNFRPAALWNNMLWHWHRRKFKVMPGSSSQKWRMPNNDLFSEDVDLILEKVHKFGLGSLTQREREILERAGRKNNKSRPFGI